MKKINESSSPEVQRQNVAETLKLVMEDESGFDRAVKQLLATREDQWPIISQAFKLYAPAIIKQEWRDCHKKTLKYRKHISSEQTRLLMTGSTRGRKERAVRFSKFLLLLSDETKAKGRVQKEREKRLLPILLVSN